MRMKAQWIASRGLHIVKADSKAMAYLGYLRWFACMFRMYRCAVVANLIRCHADRLPRTDAAFTN